MRDASRLLTLLQQELNCGIEVEAYKGRNPLGELVGNTVANPGWQPGFPTTV